MIQNDFANTVHDVLYYIFACLFLFLFQKKTNLKSIKKAIVKAKLLQTSITRFHRIKTNGTHQSVKYGGYVS